jgi:superfamily II DNA or RNA helicase
MLPASFALIAFPAFGPVLPFHIDDIVRAFSRSALEKGRAYQREGRARVERRSANGRTLIGTVRGSQRLPYNIAVSVTSWERGGAAFETNCDCPVGVDCKHAAALLLQALAEAPALASPRPPQRRISLEVSAWLERVEALERRGDDHPPEIRHRLLYLLSVPDAGPTAGRVVVTCVTARLLKDGSLSSDVKRYGIDTAFNPKPAKHLRAADLVIFRRLAFARAGSWSDRAMGEVLAGELGVEVLALMLATGRCRWQEATGPVLSLGETRSATLGWTLGADGRQRARLAIEGGGIGLALVPPWYVDPVSGLCGPLATGLTGGLAAALVTAPPLDREDAAEVRARLGPRLGGTAAGALPPELAPARSVGGPPVPRLLVHSRRLLPVYSWEPGRKTQAVHLTRLSFLYEGVSVDMSDPRDRPELLAPEGGLVAILRDRGAEHATLASLQDLGLREAASFHRWQLPADCARDRTLTPSLEGEADDDQWLELLAHKLPRLCAAGWQIDVAEDFPLRLVETGAAIEAEIDTVTAADSGIDWFELHLGVPMDGVRVDLTPALISILRRIPAASLQEFLAEEGDDETPIRLPLPDGRTIALPFGRVRPILAALTQLFSREEGSFRLARQDAALLAAFEERAGDLAWRGGEALRAMGKRLRDHAGIPAVEPPATFVGTLRPYQGAGLAWMQFLREVGLGGVLADDMGLGKTVQALAHLACEVASGRADRPSLIVAPTSLMTNWRAEAAVFVPSLPVVVLHGADRKDRFPRAAAGGLALTTYPLLARDIEALSAIPWHFVIADEAQFVKNPATTAAQALRRLEARHRLALTGTPLENSLGELWALFDFVSSGFLGSRAEFNRRWRVPIEKRGDRERQRLLSRRVRPFLLRRTKGEVASELPPKTEIDERVEFEHVQREFYEGIRLAMHRKVREAVAAKGLARSHIEFLDALLKLRQVCCDPRLVKTSAGANAKPGSAKLSRLMEMLPELLAEGRRVLLFSQFTSMLALIEAELRCGGVDYVTLTGSTKDRATPVARFQREEVPLFLISLKAGGTGLNLTAADTVIHYDPWWNPAVEAQATDRAHRIGQQKPVFVYKLIAEDTIEGKMLELKNRKQALADGLFDADGANTLPFGVDDIEFLLGG